MLPAAGISSAAPEAVPAQSPYLGSSAGPSAVICPPPGSRIKKTTEGRIYVVARDYLLYWIPNETVYFNLWGSWGGITTLPDNEFDACWSSGSRALSNGHLVQTSSGAVYIWDATVVSTTGVLGAYRWIPSWDIFTNRYHFDPAEIGPAPSNARFSPYDWT
ncbi:hypothetical protein ACWIID_32710 [Streptomyces phaeochromogenes]